MLEKEFVEYEIAKDLKELGFKEKCLLINMGEYLFMGSGSPKSNFKYVFKNDYPAYLGNGVSHPEYEINIPLYQQVIDWLIKEHNLFIDIFKWSVKYYINDELQSPRFLFDIDTYNDYSDDWIYQSVNDDLKYETYQEAREAAIIKCIEIIKNENNSKRN